MPQINLKELEQFNDLELIFNSLGSTKTRLVGGCVRDIILKLKVVDFDFATTLLPDEIENQLALNGIKSIPTGKKYGTITAIIDKKPFEITTLRHDEKTYGRGADVKFTDVWEEDAKRRDFTINALYADINGKVFDYHNGLADIKSKLVKFIGDPEKRIEEDNLRILRYFRFLAYFGIDHIDQNSLKACELHCNSVKDLSGERINNEFKKMFHAKHLVNSINKMDDVGLLKTLGFEKQMSLKPELYQISDFNTKFAILLICYSLENNRQELLKKYKFSNAEIKNISLIANWDYSDKFESTLKSAQYYQGIEIINQLINIYCYFNDQNPNKFAKYLKSIGNFPIKGDDLKKLGYNGELLGKKLKILEQLWIESDFKLGKETLLKRIK